VGIDDYEDVTYRLNPGDIASARGGDYLAAARLMDLFQRTVAAGKPLAPELLCYFAECFRQIVDGADPASALHIKKPKGRPLDPEKWLRDVELALAVEKLREAGATVEDAIAEVSEGDPKKESTVHRAYLDYGTRVFAPPNRAVDKKKSTGKKRTDTFKK
jgi:hypothetical protein